MAPSTSIPHARACDSCGDLLQPRRIYVGHIGQAHALYVCEPCAAWHSSEQYVLSTIAQARRIIKERQRQLASAVQL